ncbi:MAG: hypothetical protein PHC49_10620 [Desulfuromonadaceae bacterium]|nr:hypothetical protein [Desulfuromonadaceae bacterium]
MDSLTLPMMQLFIQMLGLPGLIFIVWHFDNKRLDKQWQIFQDQMSAARMEYEKEQRLQREVYEKEQRQLRESFEKEHKEDREQVNLVMGRYREDIAAIKQLYENNVHLITDYNKTVDRLERLNSEVMGVIALNAQSTSHLADAIKNNTFCPQVRDLMGKSK